MGVVDLKGCLSRMLLQCLARLGLDAAARASDHTVRSNSALESVLLLLKGGETKGGELHATSISWYSCPKPDISPQTKNATG